MTGGGVDLGEGSDRAFLLAAINSNTSHQAEKKAEHAAKSGTRKKAIPWNELHHLVLDLS